MKESKRRKLTAVLGMTIAQIEKLVPSVCEEGKTFLEKYGPSSQQYQQHLEICNHCRPIKSH